MRPILPIAAAVLLTAGAVSIPALTQAAQTQHHTWKKANIDTSAMSASMSAQNPSAFQPSTTDQQPGAIAPAAAPDAANTAPAANTGTGMTNDTTAGAATAPAGQTDTSMQSNTGKDDASATTGATSKKAKHAKHKGKATTGDTTMPSQSTAPATDQQPGAIDQSGSSNSAMQGNSATTGAATSPTANPDDNMTQPDASKANTTAPATDTNSTPAK